MSKRTNLLLSTITIFLLLCNKEQKQQELQKHVVGKTGLRDVISQTGEVRSLITVELKSEASGRIDTIYVKEGQAVTKGDTILLIDPSRLNYRKESMDLAVERAAIRKEIAKRNLEEAKALLKTGTISARQIVDLENEYKLAEVSYRQEILERKDIIDQLGNTVVTSPMDGVITSLPVEQGEIAVSATSGLQSGTALATIVDINRLEVVSQIGEVDYVHLRRGQEVVIRPEARENASTSGKIDFIALSAKKDASNELGTFEVRISVDSIIPGIAPGINVKVDFVIMEKKDITGVPNHLVEKTPKGYMVHKVTPEGIRKQAVKVGVTDYRYYEILEGVTVGDTIVKIHGDDRSKNNRQGTRRGR